MDKLSKHGQSDSLAGESPAASSDRTPDQAVPEQATPYAWYALSLLFLVYVLNFIDRQIITILAPDIKADLGLDDADIGFLYGTAFAVFYALFGVPLGRLADSWHRVRLLTIGLSLWSAMTAISGFARSGWQLAGARMGVGIGEATASPSAYSLISDLFPKHMRATALAIYSAGLYFGGGVSLMIGGLVKDSWNEAFPVGGPLGLVGWNVAFMAVGVPGLLLAIWVATLREPMRGLVDGVVTSPSKTPFKGFFEELYAIIPPFTLLAALRRGPAALAVNIGVAVLLVLIALVLIRLTGDTNGAKMQWYSVAFGYYAAFSWAVSLRQRDPVSFALIWGTPAFWAMVLGYSCVAFLSYASSAFAPVYAQEVLGESAARVGYWVGGWAAVAGFLGVILGGRLSDIMLRRDRAGRIIVIAFGLLAPAPFVWLAYTTLSVAETSVDFFWFTAYSSIASFCASSALGAAAATTQDLVLPRMRGTATATFFFGTTLIGLALGPYLAGQVSASTGSLSLGVQSTLLIVPIGIVLLAIAYRLVPQAADSVIERARAAGESIAPTTP